MTDAADQQTAVPKRNTHACRILQEALTNVVRPSKASQVRVGLHRGVEAALLTVQDDGTGLPAQAGDQPGSNGLLGMRERCQMLAGQFEIVNTRAAALASPCACRWRPSSLASSHRTCLNEPRRRAPE